MKRCEDCAKAYPEREDQCPSCHPPAPGSQPACVQAVTPAEPQAIGGWASAYGEFVRCPACQRPYDKRRHETCPACRSGLMQFLGQHGRPAGAAGMTMPGLPGR